MYWIFLILFLLAVLTPDIIRSPAPFLTEERVEEIILFLIGFTAFFVFIRNERKMEIQRKEKRTAEKKVDQTVKDLVESYSYIGEVNRKMDILMGIALGLTDSANLNRKKEVEIYESIATASSFLMKADSSSLRLIELRSGQTKREFLPEKSDQRVRNKALVLMNKLSVKKSEGTIIVSSPQAINGIKCFLIISGYDPEEEKSPKNMEILKVFASQALFLYSFIKKTDEMEEVEEFSSEENQKNKSRIVKYLKRASGFGVKKPT